MAELDEKARAKAKAVAIAQAKARAAEDTKLNAEMSYTDQHPRVEEADARQKLSDFVVHGMPAGLMMGADDEIAAYITGRPVEEFRQIKREAEARSPTAVGAGKMAGAGITSALPIGTTANLVRGSGLGLQSLMLGGEAAALSGLQSFNEGEGGLGPRMENVGKDWRKHALSGAVGASIAPVSRIARNLAARGRPDANLRAGGIPRKAAAEVGRAFRADAAEMDDIARYIDSLGPEARLMDAGDNLRGTASAGVAVAGPHRTAINRTLRERTAGAPGRINEALDNALGARVNMADAGEALRSAQSIEARAAYDAFNATNFPMTPEIRRMLRRANDVGALRHAQEVARARDTPFDINTIMDPNTTEISGEALDLISRSIRDASNTAWREGRGALGGALGDLNNEFLDAATGLRRIRRTYADQSAIREAAESGGDILNNRMSADAFNARWADMSEAERAAFRASARDAIEQKLAGVNNERNAGINLLGPRTTVAKLETVYGPEAVEELRRVIDSERVFRDTANSVSGNSATAARQEGRQAWTSDTNNADGLPRGPIAEGRGLLGKAYQGIKGSFGTTGQDEVNREIARALTASGPDRDRIIQALLRDQLASQNRQARGAGVERITRLLLSAGALPAGSVAN